MKNYLLSLSILLIVFVQLGAQRIYAQNNEFKGGNKPVLVEYFTGASCSICAEYDPNLEQTVRQDSDFVMAIAYHRHPGGGIDTMCDMANSADCNDRVNFYGVSGMPVAFTDGVSSNNLLYEGLLPGTKTDTVFEIENPSVQLSGNTLTYSADIIADSNISDSIYGFVAVIEKEIYFATPPGTNGQTKFSWVMRKMCPTGNGTALPKTMKVGDKQNLSGNWTLAEIYNKSELRVIFFVQNMKTHEVYWSTMMKPTTAGIHENSNINGLNIYPNPAKNEAMINFNLEKPETIIIRLTNMLGQELISKNLSLNTAGNNHYILNTGNLQTGSYLVEIKSEKSSTILKLNVLK